jgi:hypothetical protein
MDLRQLNPQMHADEILDARRKGRIGQRSGFSHFVSI